MKKNKKILLILAVFLLVVNAGYLYTKYQVTLQPIFSGEKLSEHPLFKSKVDQAITSVQEKSKELPTGSFALSGDEAANVFEPFLNDIGNADIFRIKVWNKNYTVIWSNAPEVTGKTYLDNHEVKEALEGEIEIEVKSEKVEHFSEKSFNNFAEIYIPVKDSNGNIVGVLETYVVTEDVVTSLRNEFYKSAALSFGISLAFLILAYFGAKRVLK